ncbi:hypothetical protein NE237_001516 [Protea cynaroides]|uniref:Uncharacterized protein n=1 Tax=Protea cynaroides TaxID=273540 RepID=A0A9Q0QYJ1_9MAGN|nr:hypothetical protein NE237_001516 [Protea cynaroides]
MGIYRKSRISRSVTNEDLDELKAHFELGFVFDSPDLDLKLTDTLPALGFSHAITRVVSSRRLWFPSFSVAYGKSPKPTTLLPRSDLGLSSFLSFLARDPSDFATVIISSAIAGNPCELGVRN